MRQIDAKPAMKMDKEARVASDAELMGSVCDSIKPKSEERDDLEDAFQRKEAERLDWRRIARLAAHDLKAYEEEIRLAAATGQRQFFVDLGKCLSRDMKSGFDKLDADIAAILSQNPSIKAKDAVRELARRNHPRISEENFRMRKKRLKAFARAIHERGKAHEAQINELIKAKALSGIYITRPPAMSPKQHVKSITRAETTRIFHSISAVIARQRTQQ
jgi:hypothetical protein